MVFSSIGDTTRVSPLQNPARSGLLATHPLLRSAVSGDGTLARSFFTTVLPVPLHSAKRRLRGCNQPELIAESALKALDHKFFPLVTNLRERVRPTISQVGLTRPQRQENLRGAFKVRHLNRPRGGDMLLVDDLVTTGTTAAECARVLRWAGAKIVWVATVARTLRNSVGPNPAGEIDMQVAVSQ